jgi:hypothetical protein
MEVYDDGVLTVNKFINKYIEKKITGIKGLDDIFDKVYRGDPYLGEFISHLLSESEICLQYNEEVYQLLAQHSYILIIASTPDPDDNIMSCLLLRERVRQDEDFRGAIVREIAKYKDNKVYSYYVDELSACIGTGEEEFKFLSKPAAYDVIHTRKPVGKFYAIEGKWFVGIDNSTGDAWTEQFLDKGKCFDWLREYHKPAHDPSILVKVISECSSTFFEEVCEKYLNQGYKIVSTNCSLSGNLIYYYAFLTKKQGD